MKKKVTTKRKQLKVKVLQIGWTIPTDDSYALTFSYGDQYEMEDLKERNIYRNSFAWFAKSWMGDTKYVVWYPNSERLEITVRKGATEPLRLDDIIYTVYDLKTGKKIKNAVLHTPDSEDHKH